MRGGGRERETEIERKREGRERKRERVSSLPILSLTRVPIIWANLLFNIQFFICKYVFLEDKNKSESKFIPVKHRYAIVACSIAVLQLVTIIMKLVT